MSNHITLRAEYTSDFGSTVTQVSLPLSGSGQDFASLFCLYAEQKGRESNSELQAELAKVLDRILWGK